MRSSSRQAWILVAVFVFGAAVAVSLASTRPSLSRAQAASTATPTRTSTPSPSVGEPPWRCAGNCQYAGERLMSQQSCSNTSAEGITFQLIKTGPITDTFTALVCLYDFNGFAVACNRDTTCGFDNVGGHTTVGSGVQSQTWELVGPIGVPIWKVRWFTCEGQGYVNFHGDQYCIDSCLEDTDCYVDACEPDQCDEQFIPTARMPSSVSPCDPEPGEPGAWETVQVAVTNSCQFSQQL